MGADETILRILIAVDAIDRSADVLGAVTRLAAGRAVELAGLFVEDADLMRWAGWPAATERRVFEPAPRPFDASELEAAMRAQALALQRRIDGLARALGASSSFRTVRGRVVQEALSCAGSGDCIVMSSAATALRMGVRPRAVQSRPVLWLLADDVRGLARLFAAAAQCDPGGRAERRVVLPEEEARAAAVREALASLGVPARVVPAAAIFERAGAPGASGELVLIERAAGASDPERLRRLLRRGAAPLVLV